MKTIIIRGASLGDTAFTLQAAGWPEIDWNVTRIERDAWRGVFGLPQKIAMHTLPAMNDGNRANVDWDKVGQIIMGPDEVLDRPLLSVLLTRRGDPHTYRFPVDGNHRLAARMATRLDHFHTFVVPPHLELHYRITMEEADV